MRKTLSYYFNKRMYVVCITAFILLLITFITFYNEEYIIERNYGYPFTQVVLEPYNSPFSMLAIFAGILSTIIVPLEFSFKMNKIKIDQLYSLPIKREKLFISKYLISIFEVVFPLTLSFILSFIMIIFNEHLFNLIYFIPYYFALIFYSIVLITIFSFVYTRANSHGDGIINMIMYIFIVFIILLFFVEYFNINTSYKFSTDDFILYSPISIISNEFDCLLCNENATLYNSEIVSLILFPILALVSFFLFLKLNKEDKSENCSEITNSLFSYNVLLPIYSITLGSLSLALDSLTLYIFVVITLYIGYTIKNKNFKLKEKDLKMFLILIVISFILGIFCKNVFYK